MNEPSNFVPGSLTGCDDTNKYNSPPYLPSKYTNYMFLFQSVHNTFLIFCLFRCVFFSKLLPSCEITSVVLN